MMTISQLLTDIGIYIGFSTFFLFAIITFNPRLMLQDYPPAIQSVVPPKSLSEKVQTLIIGLPFMLVVLAFPYLFIINSQAATFAEFFFYAFLIIWSFNLWDWLVLDWLVFCKITPKFFVIPGTENHPAYKDYAYHFRGFLMGTVFSIALALITSVLIFKLI